MVDLLTTQAVEVIADAVYLHSAPHVIEAYSAIGATLESLSSKTQFLEYVLAKSESSNGSAYLAVHYPEMKGLVIQSRIYLDPKRCGQGAFRFKIEGWGLIWLHLQWQQKSPSTFVSVNSEKRAMAWAHTRPELGSPADWDWCAVQRHVRRIKRAPKVAA